MAHNVNIVTVEFLKPAINYIIYNQPQRCAVKLSSNTIRSRLGYQPRHNKESWQARVYTSTHCFQQDDTLPSFLLFFPWLVLLQLRQGFSFPARGLTIIINYNNNIIWRLVQTNLWAWSSINWILIYLLVINTNITITRCTVVLSPLNSNGHQPVSGRKCQNTGSRTSSNRLKG